MSDPGTPADAPVGRRRWWPVLVLLVAALAAVGCVFGWQQPRVGRAPDGAAICAAATDAVTALMTFSVHEDPRARAARVEPHLGGLALANDRGQGPNAVLPGAVATAVAMTVTLRGCGVGVRQGPRVSVLVFADEHVTIAGTPPTQRTAAVSVSAVMQRMDGRWLLVQAAFG